MVESVWCQFPLFLRNIRRVRAGVTELTSRAEVAVVTIDEAKRWRVVPSSLRSLAIVC